MKPHVRWDLRFQTLIFGLLVSVQMSAPIPCVGSEAAVLDEDAGRTNLAGIFSPPGNLLVSLLRVTFTKVASMVAEISQEFQEPSIKADSEQETAERVSESHPTGPQPPEYYVLLDPGHGGRYEPAGPTTGDHWDPVSKKFLVHYNSGAAGGGIQESFWTLEIARKVDELLNLTKTEEGFGRFSKILEEFGAEPGYPRVRIATILTRDSSIESDPDRHLPDPNAKYRLFDSPSAYPTNPASWTEVTPRFGRISMMNRLNPDLIVCLHNNSNKSAQPRGFSSVIVPHFRFFYAIHSILTNQGEVKEFRNIKITPRNLWLVKKLVMAGFPGSLRETVQKVVSDTYTYFAGIRMFTKEFIGLRYLMVSWPFNTRSPFMSMVMFFLRENSQTEFFRRAGGTEGFGGDNFFSSQELLRFIRYSLWSDTKNDPKFYAKICPPPKPAKSKKKAPAQAMGPDQVIGPLEEPFISDWAVPLFVNSVTSYIEVGYLSNLKDREILKAKKEKIAQAIAVGIYSLFAGVKVKNLPGIEAPRGEPIDFQKYGKRCQGRGPWDSGMERIASIAQEWIPPGWMVFASR